MLKFTKTSLLASGVYQLLIYTSPLADRIHFSKYWNRLWKMSCEQFHCPVYTTIHHRSVVVNFGYTYPIYARRYAALNAPLVELAYQTWKTKRRKLTFVDVGAAVGDTVLLLYANLPDAFNNFFCVDGDREFFVYLEQNLNHLPEGRLINTLLSNTEEKIPDLLRIHTGTASAQSDVRRTTTTLSAIITEDIDLLKIDVDGFDGRVLSGAMDILRRSHPSVIFEWHPILCQSTGNNWIQHFEALNDSGYSLFLWFNKFGCFSHFTTGLPLPEINALAEYCLSDIPSDWHYDVVALHDTSGISPIDLAKLQFAKVRPSRF